MTTINLKPETVSAFLTCCCATSSIDIYSILCRETSSSEVIVQAEIPSSSTPSVLYIVHVAVENDGSTIHRAFCTCRGGKFKCKHICKVLHRIVDSQRNPLPGVIVQGLQREAEPKRLPPPPPRSGHLSADAKQALGRAIWSALRSPTGAMDPALVQAAVATGLPESAIRHSARVARNRDAQKQQRSAPPSAVPPPQQPANLQQEMVQQVVPNVRERKRKAVKVTPPSVYIAMTCWEGKHSGVGNADTDILGVFISKQLANECAEDAANENEYSDDDDEEEGNGWFDAKGLFTYYKYQPDMGEETNLDSQKFWVERFVLKGTSADFHT